MCIYHQSSVVLSILFNGLVWSVIVAVKLNWTPVTIYQNNFVSISMFCPYIIQFQVVSFLLNDMSFFNVTYLMNIQVDWELMDMFIDHCICIFKCFCCFFVVFFLLQISCSVLSFVSFKNDCHQFFLPYFLLLLFFLFAFI